MQHDNNNLADNHAYNVVNNKVYWMTIFQKLLETYISNDTQHLYPVTAYLIISNYYHNFTFQFKLTIFC